MKIFSADQIKQWDAFTIKEKGFTSTDLMESAAIACFQWLIKNGLTQNLVHLFCGKGNNGGDGLALARILIQNNIPVKVYILEKGQPGTVEFQTNLQRLHLLTSEIHFIQSESFFPDIKNDELIVDALFGTGLNKPLDGLALLLVKYLNESAALVVSIDIPSGLFADKSSKNNTFISATHTLSFQNIKLAFLFPENERSIGQLHILNIGLSAHFEHREESPYELSDIDIIKPIIKPRNKFSHKGNFGHAALVTGSHGMMGATVLAAKGCLSSGVGKLTNYIPSCGYTIIQCSVPEAMCKVSGEKYITSPGNMELYDAIGIGPGLGTQKESISFLHEIFSLKNKSIVLDADALNCMAIDSVLLSLIPHGSVITPHPKEFERLFGVSQNDFDRLKLAIRKAAELDIYIILKGHYTAVITPKGKVYFNNTGNAGMAKAGMGDVLTGMIAGFLAQQYPLPEAALLGVWLHGKAGDIAAEKFSREAMQASDLVKCMPAAWKLLHG